MQVLHMPDFPSPRRSPAGPLWALTIANLSPLDLRKDVQGKARTKSRKAHWPCRKRPSSLVEQAALRFLDFLASPLHVLDSLANH